MKETKEYQTESKELLNLMINSIYTNKEIFLRELISNASDAIDKEKYLSLTSAGKIAPREYVINLALDKKARTLTISDNGVGMNHDELVSNLGTIARSGSKEFMEKLKGAKDKNDVNIIGQFGVGFYSAFMVSTSVNVLTKKDDDKAYLFTSDGKDGYTIEESQKDSAGSTITLYIKKNEGDENYDQYLDEYTIKDLVKKYSDYIRYPIKMMVTSSVNDTDKDGKPIEGKYHDVQKLETLNSMVPLWKKNEKDVTKEEVNAFYKSKFSDYEDPLDYMFLKVDGVISYTSILFIPAHLPANYYSENYDAGLQLYAKGVYIKDKCQELVPPYLKFLRGLVDSDDFSLNISREMLQSSPTMRRINDNLEKKFIAHIKDMKEKDPTKYLSFYKVYGEQLKFGIYSSYGEKKDLLIDTLLFHSLNNADKMISLKEYKDAMKKDQKSIYYASGDSLEAIKMLPEMEKYKKNGLDVLLFDQKIDEFAIMMVGDYDKVKFLSISEDNKDEVSKEDADRLSSLTASNKRVLDDIKSALGSNVDEVSLSSKLVDSPVCISTKQGLSLGMEKTLKDQPGSNGEAKASKVLEINPDHELFKAISSLTDDAKVKEYGSLLYDEAMLLEGYDISDKKGFVTRLNNLMNEALKK
jgi:molecular chaperone HtpG